MHLQQISANDLSGLSTVRKIRSSHHSKIYDKHDLKNEQLRDSLGIVFLFHHEGRAVGTFRLVPTQYNLTQVERVPDIADLIPIPGSWEAQRFVTAPDFRGLNNIMPLYREIAIWLRATPEITAVAAICNRRVAALLKKTGLKILARNIKLDNTQSDYFLLSGSVSEICNRLLQHSTKQR